MLIELVKVNLFWIPRFLTNRQFYKLCQSFPIGDPQEMIAPLTCLSSWAWRSLWPSSAFNLTPFITPCKYSLCATM